MLYVGDFILQEIIKENIQKKKETKGITSHKITTTVSELDTVYIHMISYNIELHKTACLFSVSLLCEQTLYVQTSDVTLPLTVKKC